MRAYQALQIGYNAAQQIVPDREVGLRRIRMTLDDRLLGAYNIGLYLGTHALLMDTGRPIGARWYRTDWLMVDYGGGTQQWFISTEWEHGVPSHPVILPNAPPANMHTGRVRQYVQNKLLTDGAT